VEQRRVAWQRLRKEIAAANLPVPELMVLPTPSDNLGLGQREWLSAADLERRYLEDALLLQEADWFIRELTLSLQEVPHWVGLLDREGWLMRLEGTPEIVASTNQGRVAIGSRACADSGAGVLLESPMCNGQPAVALSPPSRETDAVWTQIVVPLRSPPQALAGLLQLAYSDRRVSPRIYSQVYTAAAAIERQMMWSDRLAQADRLSLVGTMISQIVHEVKNPLAAMKAALQLARASEGRDRDDCLQLMNKEIEELNTLVENLLGLARPAQAHFSLQCLEGILEEVLGLVRYEAALRSIRLDFGQARANSFLRCDDRLLKQAFLNLARNAIQAMPQGGSLTLTIRRSTRRGGVAVEVVDTGVGIPPDNLPHLFEPFFTTKGTAGTGLGLSVTRRIIEELHRGEISVESAPGVGTRFLVFLPFNPELRAAELAGGA
jgi:signal transduction histidine kinase